MLLLSGEFVSMPAHGRWQWCECVCMRKRANSCACNLMSRKLINAENI